MGGCAAGTIHTQHQVNILGEQSVIGAFIDGQDYNVSFMQWWVQYLVLSKIAVSYYQLLACPRAFLSNKANTKHGSYRVYRL